MKKAAALAWRWRKKGSHQRRYHQYRRGGRWRMALAWRGVKMAASYVERNSIEIMKMA
jgi:hypothetical protein